MLFRLLPSLMLFVATAYSEDLPSGLPKLSYPENNPQTEAKANLGKLLYFDKRLSRDDEVSCASCHDPAKGWSNGERFATGVEGKMGGRNSPTVINTALQQFQFWDGRAGSLEEQALGPIQNPIEMNLTLPELEEKLSKIDGYRPLFQEAFGTDKISSEHVAKAIAAFERTVLSGDSPYDQFTAGKGGAMSDEAKEGMKLFFGKARCSSCHSGPNFTDNAFHNIGIGMEAENPDVGRAAISKLEGDTGGFKTPTLREVARSGPYMHDGSIKTLDEVVKHYNKGGIQNPYLDEEIFELKLNEEEISHVVKFLEEGLASPKYPEIEPPKSFPK